MKFIPGWISLADGLLLTRGTAYDLRFGTTFLHLTLAIVVKRDSDFYLYKRILFLLTYLSPPSWASKRNGLARGV